MRPPAPLAAAAAGALLLLATAAHGCSVDEDCSLNGVCALASRTCECDPGWRGADCGVLDLAPATYGTGYNLTAAGTSSWGGKSLRDPTNSSLFHLFAAEFTHGCGLDYWSPYSRIIRAEGASPAGPFTFAQEVVGTFAHNPTVVWSAADNAWLMVHIGCPTSVPAKCADVSLECDPGDNINGESGITMRLSRDLRAWTEVGVVFGTNGSSAWDTDTTNPSLWALPTPDHPGGMLMAYRGCPYNCGGDELLSLATAPSYAGPYTRVADVPILPGHGAEDPHVWRDARGNWHLLMHSLEPGGGFNGGPKIGRHAFARASPSAAWTFNNATLAYNTTVPFTDGSVVTMYRRERPQLFFSDDGAMTPLYLTTGVQQWGQPSSYTLVQPLTTAAAWEAANGVPPPPPGRR